jgi:hypothetical protein
VSYGLRDWLSAVAQAELTSGGANLQAGARIGSIPGAATFALPVLALLLMAE